MIIALGERAFLRGVDAELREAIQKSLHAFELGLHALVVTPGAMRQVTESDLPTPIKDDLQLVHRNWLEAQGLLKRATRVVSITGEPGQHGLIEGNVYHVFSGSVEKYGIHREASHVVESLGADASYVQLLLRLSLDLNAVELRKFWFSRAEQGGGGAMRAYVRRYARNPSPTFILCDRDGPTPGMCGPTAQGCVDALVEAELFDSTAAVMAGGFSKIEPCLGFRIIAAHEMENLILPRMAVVLFNSILEPDVAAERAEILRQAFPTFPELAPEDAERWLAKDFKKMAGGGRVFDSECLEALAEWAFESDGNFRTLKIETAKDLTNPIFYLAINDLILDLWTNGACHRALM
jgi:hypothetical protein